MAGLFFGLIFRGFAKLSADAKNAMIGRAMPMLEQIHIRDLMQLDRGREVIPEGLLPMAKVEWLAMFVSRPWCSEGSQGSPRKDDMVISIRQVIVIHEVRDFVDESQVHARHQQHRATRHRTGCVVRRVHPC
jgi:hypothetical protein